MRLREVAFWLHMIMGIAAGLIILVMSVTGVLLAYEKQITAWVDRDLRVQPLSPPSRQRLPLQALLSAVHDETGARPTAITFFSNSAAAAITTSGPTLYVNVYNGRIIGTGSARVRAFFRKVNEWHRYVALVGDSRPIGKAITGAANVIFLLIVFTGLYLWLRRSVMLFKRGLRGKALYWNWHNVFGFWASLPLLVIVLSATVISYQWGNNLVYRITGSSASLTPANSGRGGLQGGRIPDADLGEADFLIRAAGLRNSDWRTMNLRLSSPADTRLSVIVDRGTAGQPQWRSTVTFDGNEKKLHIETLADQSLGRRIRTWLRFVHTGEYYGVVGQTVAAIASFAGVMLTTTGFVLSYKRLASWRARRRLRLIRRRQYTQGQLHGGVDAKNRVSGDPSGGFADRHPIDLRND